MSTVLLALALLMGLGLISFLISVGLSGLGVILSWIFPITPFQGTLLQLALFSLAIVFLGVSLLFERVRDTFWTPADEQDDLGEEADFLERNGNSSNVQRPLPPRRELAKVGRNDPCPCGSGKKYKFCCLTKL
jgi:membrane protein implicated in regulation of membrane protease activity